MKATQHKIGTMEARLARIGAQVDRLLEGSSDAFGRTGERFQKELKRIDEHLSVTRAQIKQDLARTRDDFVRAVDDELVVWKGRLEELNLQRSLGTTEMKDRMTPLLERASEASDRVRQGLRDLSEESFEEDLAESIRECLKELRSELADAEELS